MTPEEKSLLERTYKMTEENNKILVSIRRSNRLSIAMRLLYWVVIIVLSFGAYYFIQPYMTTLLNVVGPGSTIQSLQDGLNSLKSQSTPR